MEYITECLIDGTRMEYDDCCDDKYLQEYLQNKQLHKIGEGHIIYINGVENVYDELHHFFVRTNKNEELDQLLELKPFSIETFEVTAEEYTDMANKILKKEFSNKPQQDRAKEEFLDYVVFGKSAYQITPTQKTNNN